MGADTGREQRRSRRAERRLAAQRAARRRRQLRFLGGTVALAVLVAIVLIAVNRPGGASGEVAIADPPPAAIPTDGRVMGDPNAPVTVVEWGDYQ